MTRPRIGDERTNWHAIAIRAFEALAFVTGLFSVALIAAAWGM